VATPRLTLKIVDRYPYARYKRHAITSAVTAVASEANRYEAEFSPARPSRTSGMPTSFASARRDLNMAWAR